MKILITLAPSPGLFGPVVAVGNVLAYGAVIALA